MNQLYLELFKVAASTFVGGLMALTTGVIMYKYAEYKREFGAAQLATLTMQQVLNKFLMIRKTLADKKAEYVNIFGEASWNKLEVWERVPTMLTNFDESISFDIASLAFLFKKEHGEVLGILWTCQARLLHTDVLITKYNSERATAEKAVGDLIRSGQDPNAANVTNVIGAMQARQLHILANEIESASTENIDFAEKCANDFYRACEKYFYFSGKRLRRIATSDLNKTHASQDA